MNKYTYNYNNKLLNNEIFIIKIMFKIMTYSLTRHYQMIITNIIL